MWGSGLGDGDGGFLGVGEWLNRPLVSNHVNGRDAYSGYTPTLDEPTARQPGQAMKEIVFIRHPLHLHRLEQHITVAGVGLEQREVCTIQRW